MLLRKTIVLAGLLACTPMPFAFAAAPESPLGNVTKYTNPFGMLMADPCVYREGDTYYLYGTSDKSGEIGFYAYTSPDLVRWNYEKQVLDKEAMPAGAKHFWAPEVLKRGNDYFLHYTMFKDGFRNIYVAKADNPLGPFAPYSGPLFPDQSVIDSHIYEDPDTGKNYIYCVPEHEAKTGIVGAEISADFKTVLTTPTMQIKAEYGWEDLWAEGPVITRHKGTLYMVYSGSAYWEREYALGYATAKSPLGPWTKGKNNPILTGNDRMEGPGHNGLAMSPDGKELFCVYHVHGGLTTSRRTIAIDRMKFTPDGSGKPDILSMPGAPSFTPQPRPSGATPFPAASSDEFNAKELNRDQWTILNENKPNHTLKDGHLVITATNGDIWRSRSNAKNLFLQPLNQSDFSIETRIQVDDSKRDHQAGLMLLQDEDNYIAATIVWNHGIKFSINREELGKCDSRLAPNPYGPDVELKMERRDNVIRFYARKPGDRKWQRIGDEKNTIGHIRPDYAGIFAVSPEVDSKPEVRFDYFRVSKGD